MILLYISAFFYLIVNVSLMIHFTRHQTPTSFKEELNLVFIAMFFICFGSLYCLVVTLCYGWFKLMDTFQVRFWLVWIFNRRYFKALTEQEVETAKQISLGNGKGLADSMIKKCETLIVKLHEADTNRS